MSVKFYKCETCGNVAVMVCDSGVRPSCCGESMTELQANLQDEVGEKHLPVETMTSRNVIQVNVGLEEHPMTQEHYIQFIAVETENGLLIRYLKPGDKPEARFSMGFAKAVAIYAYCNVHGLWKTAAPAACVKTGCSRTQERTL
ncbi:MAG: desulfoferrodoxin [Bacteroidaceae bacterium]|nr:desulfoferrodoxin [Bacteroidaceae bacterium]